MQGILLREGKACAKLVKARLDITAAASSAGTVAPGVQVVTLTYDYWQPVCSKSRKPGQARFICIPVNELKLADYRVQVIGGESGKAFAIPVDFCFSGSTAAAALETHLQRLQYIRAQSQRFRDTRASEASSNSAHPCVWSQGEYTVTLGK